MKNQIGELNASQKYESSLQSVKSEIACFLLKWLRCYKYVLYSLSLLKILNAENLWLIYSFIRNIEVAVQFHDINNMN